MKYFLKNLRTRNGRTFNFFKLTLSGRKKNKEERAMVSWQWKAARYIKLFVFMPHGGTPLRCWCIWKALSATNLRVRTPVSKNLNLCVTFFSVIVSSARIMHYCFQELLNLRWINAPFLCATLLLSHNFQNIFKSFIDYDM